MKDFVTRSKNMPARVNISFGISAMFMAKMVLQKVFRVRFHVGHLPTEF